MRSHNSANRRPTGHAAASRRSASGRFMSSRKVGPRSALMAIHDAPDATTSGHGNPAAAERCVPGEQRRHRSRRHDLDVELLAETVHDTGDHAFTRAVHDDVDRHGADGDAGERLCHAAGVTIRSRSTSTGSKGHRHTPAMIDSPASVSVSTGSVPGCAPSRVEPASKVSVATEPSGRRTVAAYRTTRSVSGRYCTCTVRQSSRVAPVASTAAASTSAAWGPLRCAAAGRTGSSITPPRVGAGGVSTMSSP